MADSEALQQFMGVTGADESAAKFFLESSGGNVESAILSYLDGGQGSGQADQDASPVHTAPPTAAPPPAVSARARNSPVMAESGPPPAPARRPSRPAAQGKVRSLADLGNDDQDEDSDEANEYYAGGEKSGQVVRGAGKDGNSDEVEGLFDRARQAGARQGTAADLPGGAQASSGAFTGTSRTLAGNSAPAPAAPDAAPTPATPQEHVITFWRNNVFTVNDGEPRSITAPANREFLDAVVRGECPRELEAASQGAPISVSLLRRNEDYAKPQQPRNVAFSGTGRTLAGPSSEGASSANPANGTSANVSNYAVPTWEGIDEAQPSTSIQLRLADGSRMVARFNLTHTVGDIRRFILASQPERPHTFRLATAFPAAALDDDTQTIQAAGLANAVVVQKGS